MLSMRAQHDAERVPNPPSCTGNWRSPGRGSLMRCRIGSIVLTLSFALSLPLAASAVTIDWAPVGNPGNLCDVQSQGCFGTVSSGYQISKYEVTNAQYA